MARYRVAAPDRRVLGRWPGEKFDADLDEITEGRLIQCGALVRLEDPAAEVAARSSKQTEQE